MKRLFLLLALVGMIATSCEDSGIEEPSNPTEQPDDNTNEEQPGGDDNTDEEQPGGDDNTDEEQPGDDENTEEEQPGDGENEDDGELPVFEIDGPGKYTIGAEGGSIDVVVTTNLEYRLEVSVDAQSWLTIADTRAVRTERLTISVSPNNTDSERTATISVFDVDNNVVFSFTITQEYVNPNDEIIEFVDNTVKDICIEYWDTNGDAKISIGEAVAVTDIGTKFQSKDIMSFDEFKYFTGVTTIVTAAFKDCANLVKISIPDSVTTIGEEAFSGCSSLTSITIPDSVTSIGDEAFSGCTGELIINSKIVETDYERNYPSTTGWLKGSNFSSLTIGNGVTSIGDEVFWNCSSLTSITIPDSVTTIGEFAFSDCTSLTSVTIPESVTEIGDSAFSDCSSLTSVTIPDSVTTIGGWAFDGCSSLTSVTIGNGVTTIGQAAFQCCTSLRSVTIPGSVTSIGRYAFNECDRLTSIFIPNRVTTIGERAFYECDSLTSVYCTAKTPPSLDGSNVFYYKVRKIYVPTGSVNAYKGYWSAYASAIVGYDF